MTRLRGVVTNVLLLFILVVALATVNPFSSELMRFIFSFDFITYEDTSDLVGFDTGVSDLHSNNFWFITVLNVSKICTWLGILIMMVYVILLIIGGLRNDNGSEK